MAYSDKVVDHYENPRNVGSLNPTNNNVGTGLVGAPECGDVMKLQIQVENDRIVDAKFKTFGCGSAIAASSLATEWVKDKPLDEAMKLSNVDIVEYTTNVGLGATVPQSISGLIKTFGLSPALLTSITNIRS